jgi:hypothetical protein
VPNEFAARFKWLPSLAGSRVKGELK